jgi:hypothetical protein
MVVVVSYIVISNLLTLKKIVLDNLQKYIAREISYGSSIVE